MGDNINTESMDATEFGRHAGNKKELYEFFKTVNAFLPD